VNRAEAWITAIGWVGVGLIAGAWAVLMPGGFPVSHARFWMNRVLPVVAAGAALLALIALVRRGSGLVHSMNALLPGAFLASAVAGRVLFPQSAARFWWVVLALGCVTAAWTWWRRVGIAAWLGLSLLGAGAGAWAVATQQADAPATQPHGRAIAFHARNAQPPPLHRDGIVRVERSGLNLTIDPILTFRSRSPDGCWTLFAPRVARNLGPRRLIMWEEGGWYGFETPEEAQLHVWRERETWNIDTSTVLPKPVFSHLNHFCHLHVAGFEKLSLRFSACEGTFEVRARGYRAGAPARFAYVDPQRRFLVVQASSGEKGPFAVLGQGLLPADAPLTIALVRDGKQVCALTFGDFASQVSTALSPTAGWGVPQNAIEFALDRPGGTSADLWLTLAGTSVGRGWDSVGHAAGCYRNRITIR